MSWDTAWGNALGNSWGDPVLLSVAETGHSHAVDGDLVVTIGAFLLVVANSSHGVTDDLGYFVIPELRLVGSMNDTNGLVTETGLQFMVFLGTDIYSAAPVLQSSSVSVTDGQIAVQNSTFLYENIGSEYLVMFYDPGPPASGGGPHPATVVDVNA